MLASTLFRSHILLAATLCISFHSTLAQDYGACQAVLNTGLRDHMVELNSRASLDQVYDAYCSNRQSSRSAGLEIGLGLVIKAIPVQFTLGSTDTAQALHNFCSNYSFTRQSESLSFQESWIVAREAYKTFADCMDIVRNGSSVTHNFVNVESLTISVKAGGGHSFLVSGVKPSANVSCEGQNNGRVVQFTEASNEITTTYFGIKCTRSPDISLPSGVKTFLEATIQVSTDSGPYDIYWPKEEKLPEELASTLAKQMSSLREQVIAQQKVIDGLQNVVKYDDIVYLRVNDHILGLGKLCTGVLNRERVDGI